MKSTKSFGIRTGVMGLLICLFSSLSFGQIVFSSVKVPGTSPNAFIAINSSGDVLVNTGNSQYYSVSIWNRISGTDVIALSGTNYSAADINASGAVTGSGDPTHSNNLQAFLWTSAQGVQWLGSLGGNLSAASAVNNSNAVVGLSYTANNNQHAFLSSQGGEMQDLTPTLTSVGGAAATGINSSNEVVGYYFPNGSLNTLGFSWTQAGGIQNIGTAGTLAYAINDSGTIVGQAPFVNGAKHAFSMAPGGPMKDLGTLGGSSSMALSINSKGWIVGTSLTTAAHGLPHGFLWTPTGGMQDFTLIAGLSTGQQPYSMQVNDAGVIALTTNKGGYVLVPRISGTCTSSVNPSNPGQAVTFTVTLSSIAGPPPDGESVQFTISGQVYGAATISNGVAQFTTSSIPSGNHAVVASYLGDSNYLAAKYTSITQTVNK